MWQNSIWACMIIDIRPSYIMHTTLQVWEARWRLTCDHWLAGNRRVNALWWCGFRSRTNWCLDAISRRFWCLNKKFKPKVSKTSSPQGQSFDCGGLLNGATTPILQNSTGLVLKPLILGMPCFGTYGLLLINQFSIETLWFWRCRILGNIFPPPLQIMLGQLQCSAWMWWRAGHECPLWPPSSLQQVSSTFKSLLLWSYWSHCSRCWTKLGWSLAMLLETFLAGFHGDLDESRFQLYVLIVFESKFSKASFWKTVYDNPTYLFPSFQTNSWDVVQHGHGEPIISELDAQLQRQWAAEPELSLVGTTI